MSYCIKTDTPIVLSSKFQGEISRLAARRDGTCDTHFGSKLRDSKRIGKFAADAGARREALDMYPRERRQAGRCGKITGPFRKKCAAHLSRQRDHAR